VGEVAGRQGWSKFSGPRTTLWNDSRREREMYLLEFGFIDFFAFTSI
jgi:hypothetical protein